jgi:hypothetical protein
MFFADSDFQSYKEWPPTGVIHGNVARISYILAKDKNGTKAQQQAPGDRVLARSQHIFTADPALVDDPGPPPLPRTIPINPAFIPITFTEADNNDYEYDNLLLDEWLNIPWVDKLEMLTIITDILVGSPSVAGGGLTVDPASGGNIHELLCEGVGEFKIQGWYAPQQRWVPEVDPDGNGIFSDSDFFVNGTVIDSQNVPGILYPYRDLPTGPYGAVIFGLGSAILPYPQPLIDEANFNSIPGLGRALKFSFTLYDSRGVFKEGKKFTHIVYLDD